MKRPRTIGGSETVRQTVRLSRETQERLEDEALEAGVTHGGFAAVGTWIREYLILPFLGLSPKARREWIEKNR